MLLLPKPLPLPLSATPGPRLTRGRGHDEDRGHSSVPSVPPPLAALPRRTCSPPPTPARWLRVPPARSAWGERRCQGGPTRPLVQENGLGREGMFLGLAGVCQGLERPMHRNGGKKQKTPHVLPPSTRLSPPSLNGSRISSSGSKRGPRRGLLGAALATGTPKPAQIHPKMAARETGMRERRDAEERVGTDGEMRARGWWDECQRTGLVKCRGTCRGQGTCSPVSLLGTEQGDEQPPCPRPRRGIPGAGTTCGAEGRPCLTFLRRRLGPGRCAAARRWHSWTNSGTRWPSPTLRGCPRPLPVPLTPQDPGMGRLGAEPCPRGQSRARWHRRPGPCQHLSYLEVTREPPSRCPQQLRSSLCLCAGAPGPRGSLPSPKAEGDPQLGVLGGVGGGRERQPQIHRSRGAPRGGTTARGRTHARSGEP